MQHATLLAGLGFGLVLSLSSMLGAQEPDAPPKSEAQLELERTSMRIAEQLEVLRGRKFERPFEVRVASREDFLEYAKAFSDELMPEEKLVLAERAQKMLGLVPPDVDLAALTLEVLEEQVGGFYDPGEDTFYLMEGFTGAVAELILAHELTHALDDQLFDLDGGLGARSADSDALAAYHAVVEGSGMVMMTRWMIAHPPQLSGEDLAAAMPSPESLQRAPAVVWKPLFFAYLQGQNFIETGRRRLRDRQEAQGAVGANAALDQALLAPPRSTEQVLHPEKYWDEEQLDEPRAVRHGDAPTDEWEVAYDDTLGELLLALMVEEPAEIDLANPMTLMMLRYTNDAAAGWDGDQVRLLERADGARVVSLAVVMDTEGDARELHDAFGDASKRIDGMLSVLAGDESESGSASWIDSDRPHLVRWISYTGLSNEDALALGRALPINVGEDPLAGPHGVDRGVPVPAGGDRDR